MALICEVKEKLHKHIGKGDSEDSLASGAQGNQREINGSGIRLEKGNAFSQIGLQVFQIKVEVCLRPVERVRKEIIIRIHLHARRGGSRVGFIKREVEELSY